MCLRFWALTQGSPELVFLAANRCRHPRDAYEKLQEEEEERIEGETSAERGQRLEREMFLAFQRGEVDTVAQALNEGMSVDAQCFPSDFPEGAWPYKWFDGDYGDTMVHLAVRYRHVAMLEMLLRHGPSLQVTNESDKTALQLLDDPMPPKPGKTVVEATGAEYPFSGPMDEIRSILQRHVPSEADRRPGPGTQPGPLLAGDPAARTRNALRRRVPRWCRGPGGGAQCGGGAGGVAERLFLGPTGEPGRAGSGGCALKICVIA